MTLAAPVADTVTTPTWILLIAPIATVVTAILALVVTNVAQAVRDTKQRDAEHRRDAAKYQVDSERERYADARRLRDAKFARLRPLYLTLIRAAITMSDQILQHKVGWGGESKEQRYERLAGERAIATNDLNEVFVALFLEGEDAQQLKDSMKHISDQFGLFLDMLHSADDENLRGSFSIQDCRAVEEDIRATTSQLIALASDHLERLQTTDIAMFIADAPGKSKGEPAS